MAYPEKIEVTSSNSTPIDDVTPFLTVGSKTGTGQGTRDLLYVENVDDVFKRALDAGAREQQPLEDKFYGDRMGTVKDPFGHEWSIGTHIEDVSPEEMQRRMAAASPGDVIDDAGV